MEVKPATTYEQQIEKLRERGCYIRDERIAERILSQLNYYRFSAYFLPFRKEDETYREGTDFMTVYLIYEFDREMRLLLLGALEQVEIFMRIHMGRSGMRIAVIMTRNISTARS
jgi:abortive infection bacteriophage resistance protein